MKNDDFEIELRDLLILHFAYLGRYTVGLKDRANTLLNTNLRKLQADLAVRLVQVEERGVNVSAATRKRVNRIVDEVRGIVARSFTSTTAEILEELDQLAQDEAIFATKAVKSAKATVSARATVEAKAKHSKVVADAKAARKAHSEAVKAAKDAGRKPPKPPATQKLPPTPKPIRLEVQYPTKGPSPALLKALLEDRPMSGRLLKSWTDKMSRDTQDAVEQIIRSGVSDGLTTDQIVRKIIGTKRGGYTDGVLQASRRSMESFVRTAVTHIHNVAAQISYAENADVLTGWRFLATLDARTTITCAALNGRKYPLGKGPIPPRHVRCRSICQPATLTMREMGIDVDEGTPLSRASMDGPVSGDITFPRWLTQKGAAMQREILGATRAKLFREGKLSLAQLVEEDGRVLTLAQLRKLHPTAFD